jgi:hypothetical protein
VTWITIVCSRKVVVEKRNEIGVKEYYYREVSTLLCIYNMLTMRNTTSWYRLKETQLVVKPSLILV